MTQIDWTIRSATASDKLAILGLINAIQPHIPWTVEQYDWQLTRGPAGPAEIRVVECNGNLVSLYVGTRKHLWVRGQTYSCVMVQDVLTHPDYRGRGMLNAMASSFLSEIRARNECAYTFPNKLSENSFRRSGWTELMPVPALECDATAAQTSSDPLLEVPTFDVSIDSIWPDAGISVGVSRNAAYLNWRYERPGNLYRRFLVSDVGFLILKLYDRGTQKVMHICDFVLRKRARGLCKPTLAAAQYLAAQSGATQLTCWIPVGHPYRQDFEAFGFARDSKNDRFIFTTGPATLLPVLTTASHWHLSQGDSDVY
jgi:hypothetical protein